MGIQVSCASFPEGHFSACRSREPEVQSNFSDIADVTVDIGDAPLAPLRAPGAMSDAPSPPAAAPEGDASSEGDASPAGVASPEDAIFRRQTEEMWEEIEGEGVAKTAKRQARDKFRNLDGDDSAISESSSEGSSTCSATHFRSTKRRCARRLLVTHTMGLKPSSALQIIIESAEDVGAHYDLDLKILGKGAFGVVRAGRLKATGAMRAVKAIAKKKMSAQTEMVKSEIEIMKMLDHPNLLMLFEVMEDSKTLYLVLEMCAGGSLQDHIRRAPLVEKVAVCTMLQILRAVLYLHKHRIIHRDLKADNCLIEKPGPLTHVMLKVADFGLSCRIEPGKLLTRPAGTPTHMAPEVFAKRYDQAADLWSCGVICYVMLCGYLPWIGTSKEDLARKVTSEGVEFSRPEWLDASQPAVDFVCSLLTKSQKKRCTVEQAFLDKWIVANEPQLPKAKMPWKVIEDLRKFRSRNKFKRAALHVIASMLPEEDIQEARRVFLALDRDGDGFFTVDELRDCLRKMMFSPGTGDLDGPGLSLVLGSTEGFGDAQGFTYTEFLAATFDMRKALEMGLCRAAFASFDKNNDGAISISELATGKMIGNLSMDELVETMDSLDIDGNCELDYGEFAKMMRGATLASIAFDELDELECA
mmetsp:Transcript_43984/g.111354  ORF Transcript_43984/g.111354 Transcript_43984/m.111354 type:complete len:642 (-) Transcript_43984:10-1935(-)